MMHAQERPRPPVLRAQAAPEQVRGNPEQPGSGVYVGRVEAAAGVKRDTERLGGDVFSAGARPADAVTVDVGQ
jgi:hypothetical protein